MTTSIALMPDERDDDAAHAVNQQVASQERCGADRPVADAAQRQRHECNDDDGIEDHGRQNRRLRCLQPHDVQRAKHRERREEHRRDDREVFRHIVRNRERGQRPTRNQQLLADLHDLDQLGRVRVEIDHVACFFRRLRTGVHGNADVCLSERWRIVRSVTGHRDQLAVGLLAFDERHLVFGCRLRQEVVDASLGRDRRGSKRVVARDHHRLDPHRAQMREALSDATFDDVLQVDDAEVLTSVRHDERCAAGSGDPLNDAWQCAGDRATL